MGAPTPGEMGYCESVRQEEIGGRIVSVFTSGKERKSTVFGCLLSQFFGLFSPACDP
jgi:hypothetical protein